MVPRLGDVAGGNLELQESWGTGSLRLSWVALRLGDIAKGYSDLQEFVGEVSQVGQVCSATYYQENHT